MAHAYGYTIGYTMGLVLPYFCWQHFPCYTGKRNGEALPERAIHHSRTRRMPTFFLSFLRRQTFNKCHPFVQFIQCVTIIVSLAYTSSLPATNLVNDMAWALHGSPVLQRMTERMNDASTKQVSTRPQICFLYQIQHHSTC